jgi:ABC-type multidrug transport system ATPase subunit
MTMEETIEVTGLRKRFGQTVALDGMSFTARPGQITRFVGPNGAGNPGTMGIQGHLSNTRHVTTMEEGIVVETTGGQGLWLCIQAR